LVNATLAGKIRNRPDSTSIQTEIPRMTKSPNGTLEVMGDAENGPQGCRVLLPNPAFAAAEALGVQLGTSTRLRGFGRRDRIDHPDRASPLNGWVVSHTSDDG
jgi:hypothetical protein